MKSVPAPQEIIKQGGACLTREGCDAIVSFVRSRQCSNGGFAGKSARDDLYYTFFAAAVLDALKSRRSLLKLPRYLAHFGNGAELDFIHLTCLVQLLGRLPFKRDLSPIFARIETYRSRDGGYHHTHPDTEHGTAYALYLACEAYASAHRTPPHGDRLRSLLEDSAGASTDPSVQTNALAASCVARIRLGLAPDASAGALLLERYHAASGGFCAGRQTDLPDLLSTATSLYALHLLGVPLAPLAPRCRSFVESLWTEDGGFRGSTEDKIPDCEYTCYALLALGALA